MGIKEVDMDDHATWLEWSIPSEIDRLKKYAQLSEEALQRANKEFDQRMEQEASVLDESEREDFFDWHSDTYFAITEDYPLYFRYSFLTYLFAYLDKQLKDLAWHLVGRQGRQGPIESHLENANTARIGDFYKQVFKIDLPCHSESAKLIERLRKLRNIIVHQEGCLPVFCEELLKKMAMTEARKKKYERERALVTSIPHVQLQRKGISDRIVIIGMDFWIVALDAMSEFLTDLAVRVREWQKTRIVLPFSEGTGKKKDKKTSMRAKSST